MANQKPTIPLLAAFALAVATGVSVRHVADDASTSPQASPEAEPPTARVTHRPPPSRPAAAGSFGDVYMDQELLVTVEDVEDAQDVAALVEGEVIQAHAAGGVVRIALPDGVAVADARSTLQADPRVRSAAPNARVQGAAKGGKKGGGGNQSTSDSSDTSSTSDGDATSDGSTPGAICSQNIGRGKIRRADERQWHLAEAKAPEAGQVDLSQYVVAVLDTGVAYEDHTDASGAYVQAPSLAPVAIVAPYDFVNDDAHANDDHQHGTHIASTIASWGAVEGVAPGASIMPVKVLDADNSGVESDLVAGIWHAIDNGADVINMSLSFTEGYYPSPALNEALRAAEEAGILMVGAAGNEGANFATFPAAHRSVIAAGAIVAGSQQDAPIAADYSNRSARVDIVAPGGMVNDGGLNGIIAETIDPDDPTSVGLWQIAGTSQAAAVTSGALLYVLETGLPVDQVRAALQAGAYGFQNETHFYEEGLGGGWLRIDKAVEKACNGASGALVSGRFDASMMMWMTEEADGSIVPRARVTVLDNNGAPAPGVEALVTIWGTTGQGASCTTDSAGACDLAGPAAPAGGGQEAWAFSLDAVVDLGVGIRPGNVMFGSDALEILMAAIDDEEGSEYHTLAVHWSDQSDPDLGNVVEGYTVMNAGTGLATSPLGMVFRIDAPMAAASTEKVNVNLDGTGLATSPLGMFTFDLVTFDGSGLATSPLGFTSLRLVTIDGTGLATSPLGLTASTLWSGAPGAYDSGSLGLEGSMIDLSDAQLVGASDAGASYLQGLVGSGGFTASSGDPVASVLMGSGAVQAPSTSVNTFPSGDGAEPVAE